MSDPDGDPTRRTRLAAERTWLAWWRSGIAASTAAVAVGGVVPELVDSGRVAWIVLGCGYALLSAGVFALAAIRRRQVERALTEGRWERLSDEGVVALTLVAMTLALATLVVIIASA